MRIVILISCLFFSHLAFSQSYNVDELIKMRSMDKIELDNFLKNKDSNWVYTGFSSNKHHWALEKPKDLSVMVLLKPSFEGYNKEKIQVITLDPKINNGIKSQIKNYKMKRTYSNIENVKDDYGNDEGELLTEVYEGANYKITLLKAYNDTGVVLVSTLLEKK